MADDEYRCGYCDATFSDRASLHNHMKRCMNNPEWEESKVYECPKCGASFSSSEAYNEHKKSCST